MRLSVPDRLSCRGMSKEGKKGDEQGREEGFLKIAEAGEGSGMIGLRVYGSAGLGGRGGGGQVPGTARGPWLTPDIMLLVSRASGFHPLA